MSQDTKNSEGEVKTALDIQSLEPVELEDAELDEISGASIPEPKLHI